MKVYTDTIRFTRTGLISADIFEVENVREMYEANETLRKHGYGYYFGENNCDIYTMHGDMQLPYCVTSWAVIKKV